MADWTEFVMNPQAVVSVFGARLPSLRGVDVHSIVFNRDGPTISLIVTLPDYPDNPPEKWVRQQANTAQISLQLIGVKAISLEGWGTENFCDLEIRRDDSALHMRSGNSALKMSIKTGFIQVAGVSAYCDERR